MAVLLLSISLVGQVPQGVIGAMDKKDQPELKAKVYWDPVAGAIGYKIYQYGSVGGPCPTSDGAYSYDDFTTDPVYPDDPNPKWYAVSVYDRGSWQHRWWCYEITSVLAGGAESTRSEPVQIAIGTSGYVTMQFQTACANGNIIHFPYTFDQMQIHLYYRDANQVDHEFDYLTNSGPTFAEIEWKIPEIAKDGTVIPLVSETGYNGYWYSWKTPDMSQPKEDNFLPVYQPDAVSYSQTNIRRVQYTADCPMPWERPGADYVWRQNVTR